MKFLIESLAVYRLAILLAEENGPFDIILNTRSQIETSDLPSWVKEGVACPLCISFWLAVLFTIRPFESRGDRLKWWLGIAGAAALMVRATETSPEPPTYNPPSKTMTFTVPKGEN